MPSRQERREAAKRAKEEAVDKAVELEQETDIYSGARVWTSMVGRVVKQHSEGLSLEELIESKRIVSAYGEPCPALPADKRSDQDKAEFYHNWVKEQLKEGGLQFYEQPDSRLPVKLTCVSGKDGPQMKSAKPAKVKPKMPSLWNRIVDFTRTRIGLPGTDEMIKYRKDEVFLKAQENVRAERVKQEKESRKHLKPLFTLQEKSLKQVNAFTSMSQEEFERSKDKLTHALANLMVCDGYRRLNSADPQRAVPISEKIHQAVDTKAKDYTLYSEEEKRVVSEQLLRIQTPAALKAFVEGGGRGRLVNDNFINVRVQSKELSNRHPSFTSEAENPAAKTDENAPKTIQVTNNEAKKHYENLCEEAEKSLEELKQITYSAQKLTRFEQATVRKHLAVVVLQSMVGQAIIANDVNNPSLSMLLEGLDPKAPNSNTTSFYKTALRSIEDGSIRKLDLEHMTGKQLGAFLGRGGENKMAREHAGMLNIEKSEKENALEIQNEMAGPEEALNLSH